MGRAVEEIGQTVQEISARLSSAGVRRGRRWILKGASWELQRGAVSAVIGPNGSGKSTLARLLAGHLWPTEGSAELADESQLVPAGTMRSQVRLVQPSSPLDFEPNLTTRQVILTGFFGTLGLYDRPTGGMTRRASSLIGAIGLLQVADAPYGLLSTGEKVRAQIARAMAVRPGLLILDEPTNGLDLLAREQVLLTIGRTARKSRGTTILLITHHVEELPPQTREVLLLAKGRMVASGAPAKILNAATLSRAYGVKVEVHCRHGRYYTTVHPRAWAKWGG
jgi:iron complex transport system ATP-binding protein